MTPYDTFENKKISRGRAISEEHYKMLGRAGVFLIQQTGEALERIISAEAQLGVGYQREALRGLGIAALEDLKRWSAASLHLSQIVNERTLRKATTAEHDALEALGRYLDAKETSLQKTRQAGGSGE